MESDDEEDIESIIEQFKREQAERVRVTEEVMSEPPSRRANATLTANPVNTNELILFGGEFYDGAKCEFYNDLFRYNIEKDEWKKISSPNSPGPRSSHQVIITPSGTLFLFGGEFASKNESQFFHYKDFWSFDLKTNEWERLELKLKPSPRSGHRMALWKNFIVLFGGFYDTHHATKYFNDTWIFDTLNYTWKKVEFPSTMMAPSARSGFQMWPVNDGVVIYGGYCKVVVKGEKAKGMVHGDMWVLKMSSEMNQIKWERKKKSGIYPSLRCGMSISVYKNRAVAFGGVFDEEISDEDMTSICYNDMFVYQIDSNKWYPLNLKQAKSGKKKRRKEKPEQLDNETNAVQNEGAESDIEPESVQESTPQTQVSKLTQTSASRPSDQVEELKPCPRFNSMTCVQKNHLYIFGGILDLMSREYTLDDFWCVNLDKMDSFKIIKESQIEHEWAGESDDDDDDDDDDSEEDSEEDMDSEDAVDESGLIETLDGNENTADRSIKKGKKSKKLRPVDHEKEESEDEEAIELRKRQEQLQREMELKRQKEDAENAPKPKEQLADYFSRTNDFWVRRAFELENSSTGKALRREAFDLAKDKWTEWQPLLEEVLKLEVEIEDSLAEPSGIGAKGKGGEKVNISRNRR